jgi:hypothetical protein
MCLRNLIFSSFFLFLREFRRHMSHLSIGISFNLPYSTSSSSSRKIIPSTILSSLGTSSYICMTMKLSILIVGLLSLVMDNSLTSVSTFSSSWLDFLSGQLLFFFQGSVISIFNYPHSQLANFILDFISQAINVSGNLLLISLMMPNSNFLVNITLRCNILLSNPSISGSTAS